jgi:Nodulation protein Z (NodZ)
LPRYLVTRPYTDSNIGSNLSSLAGALWLACRLRRDLIVDWRGMSQLQDKSLNYFPEFFEHPDTLLGVHVHYAPVAGADYDDARPIGGGEAAALGGGGVDPPERYLVLEMFHGPDRIVAGGEAERFALLRSFYRSLEPGPEVRSALDEWSHELDVPFVVGVNVRTGNGRYFGRGGQYAGRVNIDIFKDEERFLRVIRRACVARTRSLPRFLRRPPTIFFATDSEPMSCLLARLPNAKTRRTLFPPPGRGDLYAFPADGSDRRAVVDTLADMFLLARCDALVYNTSVFNQYARVVTGCFGGNMTHLETRFLRCRLAIYRAQAEGIARRRLRPARRRLFTPIARGADRQDGDEA